MFKSSLLGFSKSTSETDKQKQKKRLSFKEPEIEKSSNTLSSGTGRHQLYYESDISDGRRLSLENLTLEDEAFRIARSVGSAFVKPGINSPVSLRTTDVKPSTKDCSRETTIREVHSPKPFAKEVSDRIGYLDELSPPKPDSTIMRCPITEVSSESLSKNVELMSEQQQQRIPTIAHHQIQLLHYQLEQQRQQTRTAMYHTQLLKDQLEAESSARYKAQVHNHQLMVQNKELLDHIQKLFQQIQELEQKIEGYQNKTEMPFKPETNESSPVLLSASGFNPLSHRRNSGNVSSLWSSSSPTSAYSPARSSQLLPEPSSSDGIRRPSLKDDSSIKLTPYDTDWRYRRRGSNTLSPVVLDQSKSRSNELSVSAEVNKANAEPSLNHGLSTSIPELKVTSVEGTKRDEGVVRRKDTRLSIGDSSFSQWTNGQADPLGKDHKPNQSESLSVLCSSKTLTNSDTGMQKKFTKSLDTLRLFN